MPDLLRSIQPPGQEKLLEWTTDGDIVFYLNGTEALRVTWAQVIQAVWAGVNSWQ
jgi:hypothetical protein